MGSVYKIETKKDKQRDDTKKLGERGKIYDCFYELLPFEDTHERVISWRKLKKQTCL